MRKLKILHSTEAEYLATGYATYSFNIMRRLFESGKYEIATHASYGHPQDSRISSIPWMVYGNLPFSQEEQQEYASHPQNQFGKWRFNDVVLDFKPDVVFSITDAWMYEHLLHSPFRRFYKLAILTACDGEPQNPDWLGMWKDCDAIMTYTDWAKSLIERESGGQIKPFQALPAGADTEVYKPIPNKKAHKKAFGLPEECFIIGYGSRNQARKLFPDLFKAFRQFLTYCDAHNPTLGKKIFLYCHTSTPDSGWSLAELLKEHGIGHKVLFTYLCRSCRLVFPSPFQDSRGICPRCGKTESYMPNTQFGVDTVSLSNIYNLFDLYVQYSNSEGLGMIAIEAAACGVPVMEVDYSAMSDVVKKLKGTPIRVKTLVKESSTGCYRAAPDNDHFVECIFKFFNLPESIRTKKSFETRKACIENFSYDKTAKGWMDYFDSLEPQDETITWKSPPRIHHPKQNGDEILVPKGLTNEQLVNWTIVNVLGEPERLNTYFAAKLVRDLNYGLKVEGMGGPYISDYSFLSMQQKWATFGPQEMLNLLYNINRERNLWESRRCGLVPYNPPSQVTRKKLANCH